MSDRLSRLVARARGLAVTAGLADYAPPSAPDAAQWTERYDSGGWDYLGGIDQLAQYSVLVGYIAYLDCRTILDIGCGAGLLRVRMNAIDFDSYVGVDPVAAAIRRAEPLADARSQFIVGDAFLPDLGRFDAVVCNELLYCVPEPAPLIDRARELVGEGGFLLTSNIRHPGDAGLYRMLAKRFTRVAAVDVSNDTQNGRRRRRVAVYTPR